MCATLSNLSLHVVLGSYDVALYYLKQSNYDLDAAVESYLADEEWEKQNPVASSSKGPKKPNKSKWKPGSITGLTGQI